MHPSTTVCISGACKRVYQHPVYPPYLSKLYIPREYARLCLHQRDLPKLLVPSARRASFSSPGSSFFFSFLLLPGLASLVGGIVVSRGFRGNYSDHVRAEASLIEFANRVAPCQPACIFRIFWWDPRRTPGEGIFSHSLQRHRLQNIFFPSFFLFTLMNFQENWNFTARFEREVFLNFRIPVSHILHFLRVVF